MNIIIGHFKVTDAQRRAVGRFLGRDALATREEMRAFLQQHGTRGLEQRVQLDLQFELKQQQSRAAVSA